MAARGERRESLTLVQRVESRPYRDHHVAYSLGAAYAGLGNNDEAMRWLQQAAQSGFLCRPWYESDPLLEPLRGHREYVELIAYVRGRRDTALSADHR